ncbi:MAG: FadR/GntR family transcriptional regulator [Solirubrobacterales bacterium]
MARAARVREQLQSAIESGEFGPGDRLPSERELCRMLGVSRVSVREAIRSLEAIGMVEVHHGRGCFVSESVADAGVEAARQRLERHKDEVFELLRVRGALDELAAHTAAQGGEPKALKRVRAAHESFAKAVGSASMEKLARLDVAFHTEIAVASGSELLQDLLRDLHEHLAWSRGVSFAPEGRARESEAEHEAIVEAIERADSEGARKAVARHIARVREVIAAGPPAAV